MSRELVDVETAQRDRELILRELQAAECQVRGDKGDVLELTCGYHGDRTPSAQLRRDDQGVWRYRCHTSSCGFSGDVLEVIARNHNTDRVGAIKHLREIGYLTTQAEDRSRPRRPSIQHPTKSHRKAYETRDALDKHFADLCPRMNARVEAVYAYRDPDTDNLDLIVYRFRYAHGGKTVRQAHQDARGFWPSGWDAERGKMPIYNRRQLRECAQAPVVVVEGENKVGALHRRGFLATCSAMGAGKAHMADWSPLAGRDVFLWPDHDAPDAKTGMLAGIEHMRAVAAELKTLRPEPTVFWIDPETTGVDQDGSDCVDLIDDLAASGATDEQIHELLQGVLDSAQEISTAAELSRLIEAIQAQRVRAIELPWPTLHRATQALTPGSVTILCGHPGASKSFMAIQLVRVLRDAPGDVAALLLEDDLMFHLMRALAQDAGASRMTTLSWVAENPSTVAEIMGPRRDFINAMGQRLKFLPDSILPDGAAVLDWLRARAASGVRVLIVDPFSLMSFGDKPWVEDAKFVREAKLIARRHGTSIVLVTHPRKHAPRKVEDLTLDDVAGSAFVTRFANTVVWLAYHEIQSATVRAALPTDPATEHASNRTLVVLKARSGPGENWRIAADFDRDTLRLNEFGRLD